MDLRLNDPKWIVELNGMHSYMFLKRSHG